MDLSTAKKTIELNPAQQAAVDHITGSMVVIAGAGSGKTRVITSRIIKLLQQEQVHPAQIIALTFTNKAAHEMRERIKSQLPEAQVPFIGTFHAYCLYFLKKHARFSGLETFSIFDEDDKKALITRLLKQSPLHKKYTPQAISYQISHAKNQLSDPHGSLLAHLENPELAELIQAYEHEKSTSKCLDFDDLLLHTAALLKSNTELRSAHQHHIRHILVDEYQDTNIIQHELLKLMSLEQQQFAVDSICVVGDEDQSIYSWRGATVENIIEFSKDFKNAQLFKIEQNYRSKQPILTTANHVIQNNTKRNEKTLWSTREGNDCVRVLRCLSGYQEAEIIARFCKLLLTHKKLTDTAILYRTHIQSRLLEEALIKQSVPYHMIGGVRFYERKEIKDLLAYLRVIINPFDKIAFTRVINTPNRGLGDKFIEDFLQQWSTQPLLSAFELLAKLINEKFFPAHKTESLQSFCKLFTNKDKTSPTAQVLTHLITEIEYKQFLQKNYEKQEADERYQNIKELLNAAHFFSQQGKISLEQFMDEVSLLQDKGFLQEQEQMGVTLMTLHAAKGLEFDTVIIPGLEESLFPSSRSVYQTSALEEERRLLYVGITRARERLLITSARYRQTYGQMEEQQPSRFLEELPTHVCAFKETFNWQIYDTQAYFSQWMNIAQLNPEVFTFASAFPFPKNTETSTPQTTPARTTAITTAHRHIPAYKNSPKKINAPGTPEATGSGMNRGFKKHQTVTHKTFGVGIVQEVDARSDKVVVTARFRDGVKKVDGSFLS